MPQPQRLLLITLGDPAGIGPEVAAAALAHALRNMSARPPIALVGNRGAYERAVGLMPGADRSALETAGINWLPSEGAGELAHAIPDSPVLAVDPDDGAVHVKPGRPGRDSGSAAWAAVDKAIDILRLRTAANEGRLPGALVTAPLSKEWLRAAGSQFHDHTTMLGAKTGRDTIMAFVGGGLRVALATIHIPLMAVPHQHSPMTLARMIMLAGRELGRYERLREPVRVAVCGLNPHAGEHGMFGDEDQEWIAPAIAIANEGRLPPPALSMSGANWPPRELEAASVPALEVTGPWPADSLFWRARQGEFDVVVAMYHDQGLIPVKTVAFHEAVNATLHLPFVRTSPDHGTAFDIAGQGVADPRSMISALTLAAHWLE